VKRGGQFYLKGQIELKRARFLVDVYFIVTNTADTADQV
jgi:hypothetical protein